VLGIDFGGWKTETLGLEASLIFLIKSQVNVRVKDGFELAAVGESEEQFKLGLVVDV
jgi:hypothetical protein